MPERDRTPIPNEDLLAAYELGLLDDDEQARFEAALVEDPELLDDLYDGAPAAIALQADPGRFARSAARGLPAAGGARPGRRWFAWLWSPRVAVPVAAALALFVILGWPGGDTGGVGRLALIEPLPTVQVELRAGGVEADRRYEAAMAAYRDARWDAASAGFVSSLAVAESGWTRADQARLYAGSGRLLAGRPAEALVFLQTASQSPLAPVRESALWQLAQARLTLDDAAAARAALTALENSPVYGERARAQRDELPAH